MPSLGPPLHLLLVVLQIGQGWMSVESMTHMPAAAQLGSAPATPEVSVQLRPTLAGLLAASHRRFSWSPVRLTVELSGMSMLALPVSHCAMPEAFEATVLMTHVLSAG